MVTQFTHFEKVAVFSGSLEVVDLRFVVRKILRLSNVKWKTNPNYLSGNCCSRLSYHLSASTCQRIVRKDSVTAERYRNNILDVFINQLLLAQGYFQQDGATARETLRYLRQFFDDRLIKRDLWPVLTPLDNYLFPYLKNTIFKEAVHRIDDLKSRIKEKCERVTPYTLVRVFENMKRRLPMCTEGQGCHFQHLL
jgi:hypothetical protein